jgi:Cyclin, C-terminal domain
MYEEDMFIQMERHVMANLEWYISAPTVDAFLQMALDTDHYQEDVEHMAYYIAENALHHRDFVSVRPSDLARSSLYLARVVLQRKQPDYEDWELQHDDAVVLALSQMLHSPSYITKLKYRSPRYSQVAVHLENFLTNLATQQDVSVESGALPLTPPREVVPSNVAACGPDAVPGLQTPQKANPYGPQMLITPPLTPENEPPQQQKAAMASNLPGLSTPSTPSPQYLHPLAAHVHPAFYPPVQNLVN